VSERPYVVVSCAMSVDGYIDDRAASRLILSGEEDLDRVDEVRASSDVIMVGASTVRRDNPRLVIRSAERRAARVARGQPENPVKATVTASGDLPPASAFFTVGSSPRLVYCARAGLGPARARLSALAEVVDAGDSPSPALILNNLSARFLRKVLLEGGGRLASSFLLAGLVDELHLVVAPFFVGDPAAPRFAGPGLYPHDAANRMQLAEVQQLGDVVLLRYLLDARVQWEAPPDQAAGGTQMPAAAPVAAGGAEVPTVTPVAAGARVDPGGQAGGSAGPSRSAARSAAAEHIQWLRQAIAMLGDEEAPVNLPSPPLPEPTDRDTGGVAAAEGIGVAEVDVQWLRETIKLSRRCPPSRTAFSVGAIIVGADGTPLSTGYSRERDLRDHAEEVALAKIPPGDPRLASATLYSSLEPCGVRNSRPRPCADLIIAAGIPRVVYAWHEPPILAAGGGAEMLTSAGVSVIEIPELAIEARAINAHLTHPGP
jgi:5-amino-6-(5-phosphoribosylamino)uracil reductase